MKQIKPVPVRFVLRLRESTDSSGRFFTARKLENSTSTGWNNLNAAVRSGQVLYTTFPSLVSLFLDCYIFFIVCSFRICKQDLPVFKSAKD